MLQTWPRGFPWLLVLFFHPARCQIQIEIALSDAYAAVRWPNTKACDLAFGDKLVHGGFAQAEDFGDFGYGKELHWFDSLRSPAVA